MEWDGSNRRRFPRILYPCLVKISSPEQPPSVSLTHTENIGPGGICVILKKEIKMFTPVEIELDLIEEARNFTAKGRVVWLVRRKAIESVKPMFYDIGIEFQDLSPQDKQKLEVAVNKFIQKGYKILKPVY